MMLLPWPPRRAWLLSFWAVVSLAVGFLIGTLSWFLLSPQVSLVSVIGVGVVALPGFLWPQQVVELPYRLWNTLASSYAQGARFVTLSICFYLTFVAVGRSGSSLRLARPQLLESMWVSRETLAPTRYVHQDSAQKGAPTRGGWIRNYCSWACQSRHDLWAVCLLPFLFFLRACETGKTSENVPTHIYTLF